MMAGIGVRTKKGNLPTAQFVDLFFRNRFYMGVVTDPWTGEERDGLHEPMISKELFARVQLIVSRRNKSKAHTRDSETFALRGWARCESCHHYLTASLSKGRKAYYPYYHCINKGCELYGKSIRAARVHQEFTELLTELTFSDAVIPIILYCANRELSKTEEIENFARRQRSVKQKDHDQELNELIRMRSREKISDKEFENARARLLLEQAAVATELQPELRARARSEAVEAAVQLFKNLAGVWQRLRGEKRAWFQRTLLPLGFIVGQIRTAQRGLTIKLFGIFSDRDSTTVALTPSDWNQFMLEIQSLSELFDDSCELSEEVKAMFEQKTKRYP
jgi:hypothetical protein